MLTLTGTGAAGATMTSREIADLTGKDHKNVMADVRLMLEQLQIEPAEFSATYRAGNGQDQPMFVLPKDLTLTLVSGYNVVMRKTIIDRWMTLEAAPSVPAELSRLQVLELAMASERERLALAEQLAAAAPAVEFVERYVDSTGLKGFRQVAKLLKAKENEFREFLLSEKVLYRLGGEMAPFAQHLDAGRFAVKAGTARISGHAFNTAQFTPKGVAWVAGEFAKWQVAQRAGREA